MKRPLVQYFVAGSLAALLVALASAFGLLNGAAAALEKITVRDGALHRFPNLWQYPIIIGTSFFASWLALLKSRNRATVLVGALMAELLVLAFLCGLYHAAFSPWPAILAALLGFLFAWGISSSPERTPENEPLRSPRPIMKPRRRTGIVPRDARLADVTAIVCDLANKYDLAETLEPAEVARLNQDFIGRARQILLDAGAYVHAADGEGVVGLFGFDAPDQEHATKAIAAAFSLLQVLTAKNGESETNVHVGASSGPLLSASGHDGNFVMGEPIELARRFAVANHNYGSRILIGPRTFELASERFVSRPIDFLGGGNAQQRHEIYEPLAETAGAPKDLIERRDHFWNGIVLYREKRWGEAYSQFQKARAPEGSEDEPLNLYLRRLEPLALHLVESDI